MCHVLGVPAEDYPLFRGWTNEFLSTVPVTAEQREASMVDFAMYVSGLIARKRIQPSDDVIGYLIANAGVSEEQMTYWIMSTLAVGTNALANVFGRIILMLLLDDRKMWKQVLDHGEFDLVVLDEPARPGSQGRAPAVRQPTKAVTHSGPVGIMSMTLDPGARRDRSQAASLHARVASSA
jgi:cytochrome P450